MKRTYEFTCPMVTFKLHACGLHRWFAEVSSIQTSRFWIRYHPANYLLVRIKWLQRYHGVNERIFVMLNSNLIAYWGRDNNIYGQYTDLYIREHRRQGYTCTWAHLLVHPIWGPTQVTFNRWKQSWKGVSALPRVGITKIDTSRQK